MLVIVVPIEEKSVWFQLIFSFVTKSNIIINLNLNINLKLNIESKSDECTSLSLWVPEKSDETVHQCTG